MSLSQAEARFHDDAAAGRTAEVKVHIANGVDIDSRNPSGGTALMIAAKRGKLSVVKVLLDAGANPNIALHKIAYRALHTAAQEGHTSVVAELIDKGAEIDAATEYGETALISAAFAGQSSACQLLLDRGAALRATDSKGNTAARWAAKKGHYKLAFTLWRATRALRPMSNLKSFGTGLDADKLSSSSEKHTSELHALLRRIDSLNNQLIRLMQAGEYGTARSSIIELTGAVRALVAFPTDSAAARAAGALGDATQAVRNFGFPEAAELATAASEVLKSMGSVAEFHIRRGLNDPDPDVQHAFSRTWQRQAEEMPRKYTIRHEPSKGFSFELPDGWHRDEHNLQIMYFGPKGRIGSTRQVIRLVIGSILPQYHTPEAREKFLAEPGATVHRTVIGGETNAVILKKQSNNEMSVVRDGIHYSFDYGHDTETLHAIELVRETARFPTLETASSELHRWKVPLPAPRPLAPSREEPAVQRCKTCSHQMQVLGFAESGRVMLSEEDLAEGIGHAEQCWECEGLYCSECYPSRPSNTCVCGRGRDTVRHVGNTVYRGSLRLVKVRYIS